jgi:glutathione peroxidase-family protein
MVGKSAEFVSSDVAGQPVDVKDLKGKVVLIVTAPHQWDEEKIAPLKKLDEALNPQGLEIILVSHDNAEIAKEALQSHGESWIVTTRYGGRNSKNWIDYAEYFGSSHFALIVDREGIVTIARVDASVSPELIERLTSLFPEQMELIADLAADVRRIDEETRKRSEERSQIWLGSTEDKLPDSLEKLMEFRGKTSLVAPSEMQLALVNLILASDDLPQSKRSRLLYDKVYILGEIARKTVINNPNMRPEKAFEEVNALADELLKSEDEIFRHNLLFAKQQCLYHMREYLKTMETGYEEYAEEITTRFVEITRQAQDGFYHNSDSFVMFYQEILEDIDAKYSTQLTKSFVEQVIPLFAAKSPEYQQSARQMEGILRRVSLLGSEMEFEAVLLDDSQINVKDLRGKIVLVNFWATTCGPCLREFPHMKELYEKYKPQGYEMIAYSCGDDFETLKDFTEKTQYPWPVGSLLMSIDKGLTNYNEFYGITSVPTSMILDRSGKVRFMMVGSDDELLTKELEKRFEEEP